MTTTAAQLRILVDANEDDTFLMQCCQQADVVVDNFLADKELPPAVLPLIALNLAGHYYVISAEIGGLTYAKKGQSEERYKSFGYDAHGYMATRFGQQACTLDISGTLTAMSNKDKTAFDVESYTNRRTSEAHRAKADGS